MKLIIKLLFIFIFSSLLLNAKQVLDNNINLTNQENIYLKNINIIKMCNNPNWKPIEFAEENNMNQMSGIAIDTMKLIENKLNIKFQNIPTKNWTQSQQFLKEKKCDILPAAIKTKKRKKYANFTKPYLNYKLAIITKNDKPFVKNIEGIIDKSIARKKGSGLIHKLKAKYPNINIVETKDYLEALQKVSNGTVYCTIATLPVASYYINQFALNNLHIAGYTNMTYNLSIAVRDDKPELLSILDKTLEAISKREHKDIYSKWANVKIKEQFNYTYLINTLILIFIIVVFITYRQLLLKKQNQKLKDMVEEKTKELKEINENLEQKVIFEVDKSSKREKQLFEAAKMVQMGEMIGNIAHQ
ncbi:MAG: transporter substrate-binding domain-containing protein, partial [Arcobacteraceae bacterium]|nr:transporter substrate-binding domain-containing protein [Arcobacteraceae bacterium]